MKKSWTVTGLVIVIAGSAVYRLVSNRARIESELKARERLPVTIPVTVQVIGGGSVNRSFSVEGVVGAEKEVTVLSQAGGLGNFMH